jgi:hypothetical protein
MNERNVAALTEMVSNADNPMWNQMPIDPESVARWFAAHGVLAADALTDEQCLTVLRESRDWERGWESLTRAALARIAKGETP